MTWPVAGVVDGGRVVQVVVSVVVGVGVGGHGCSVQHIAGNKKII